MARLTLLLALVALVAGSCRSVDGSSEDAPASTLASTPASTPLPGTPPGATAPVPGTIGSATTAPPLHDVPVLVAACAAPLAVEAVGTVEPVELDEISGVVASRRHPGVLWVHEDSGAGPELWAIDHSGALLATVTLAGVEAVDWEDIALGPGPDGAPWLYVGDIGDNTATRASVTIHRFPEPDISDAEVEAEPLVASYEGGPTDAEALVVDPAGTAWVIAKQVDGPASVFRLEQGSGRLAAAGSLDLGRGLTSAVTGADLSADGTALVLRTYTAVRLYDLGSGGMAGVSGTPRDQACVSLVVEEFPPAGQGEAVAFAPEGDALFTISEGQNPSVHRLSAGA